MLAKRVKLRWQLFAAALRERPRAANTRRLIDNVISEIGEAADVEALAAWCGRQPTTPGTDAEAARALAADDFRMLAPYLPDPPHSLEAWLDPETAVRERLAALCSVLKERGLAVALPRVFLVAELPGDYSGSTLAAVSLDQADADAMSLETGIYLTESRLCPFLTEATLGHVLIHAALGQNSPQYLGRGLEEGLAEVLGSLWAAAELCGAVAIDAAWSAHRLSPTYSPRREATIAYTRMAAWIHRQHGLAGLIAIINAGRLAVKQAEETIQHGPGEMRLPRASPDLALEARLESLLERRARPVVVPPLSLWIAAAVELHSDVDSIASHLRLTTGTARTALARLAAETHLVVTDAGGKILAEDVSLMIRTGSLRYDLPSLSNPTSERPFYGTAG